MALDLALVQFAIAPSDPNTNLARMAEMTRRAASDGAQLVVFPEDAVTGPLSGQTAFVAHAADYLQIFQALAVKHGVDIVPGSWTIAEGAALYNAAWYINKDGSVAGSIARSTCGTASGPSSRRAPRQVSFRPRTG